MPESFDSNNQNLVGKLNIRTIILAVVCLATLLLLYSMYAEQSKLERLSTHHVRSDRMLPNSLQIVVPPPNITNIVSTNAKNAEGVKWDYNWDMRAWKDPSDAQNVPVRTLVLVRHGAYDGQTGSLTNIGRQQANLTGVRLKEMNMNFSRLVHSGLIRAQETAQSIQKNLGLAVFEMDPLLQEGGPMPPSPTITYWNLSDRQYYVDGPRIEAAFRKYFYRADKSQPNKSYELLVAHGNVIRYFLLRCLQLESSAWMRFFIAHASISVIHIHADSTVTVTRLGDSGHLPNKLVSF